MIAFFTRNNINVEEKYGLDAIDIITANYILRIRGGGLLIIDAHTKEDVHHLELDFGNEPKKETKDKNNELPL